MSQDTGAVGVVDIPITIILPVKHYVPRYLKAAVQSVLDQSSGDWRLVLVADRSVAAELKSFLQGELSDSRFQAHRRWHPEPGGNHQRRYETGLDRIRHAAARR